MKRLISSVFMGGVIVIALALMQSACEKKDAPIDWEVQRHYNSGNLALSEKRLDAAEKKFRLVLAEDSRHVGAYTNLARVLCLQAQESANKPLLAEACTLLDKAVKLDPSNEVAWFELARVAEMGCRPKRAIQALEKLLTLEPQNTEYIVKLAHIYESTGDNNKAQAVLKNAINKGIGYGEVSLAFGQLLLKQGKKAAARKILMQIPACPQTKGNDLVPLSCPTSAYYIAQDELGALAVREGQWEQAREIYERLIQMFPDDYMAWEVLAALDEQHEEFSAAEKKYRESLAIDGVHISGWRGLGRVLTTQGQYSEARYAFRMAEGLLAKSPEQAIDMADELVALGDKVWAKSLLEKARILLSNDKKIRERIDAKLKKIQGELSNTASKNPQ